MGEVMVVTSGKGGVGKTTTVANLGFGLARLNKRVVLIDTDSGLRNLDVVLGMEEQVAYHLTDVLSYTCRLRQALIQDRRQPELYLIPAAPYRKDVLEYVERLRELTEELRKQFDYVILDCPAGIGKGFEAATQVADRAILVTVPEVSAIRDADRVISLLGERYKENLQLLINRVHIDLVRRGFMLSPEDVQEVLDIPLLGVVPEDEAVHVALTKGEPLLCTHTHSGVCYGKICKRLLGETIPISISYANAGWFYRIAQILAR
ncbi:septum site-determining protein MinD [Lachnospiraceae bacterium XBB1006]|nr:septum site-determining protein MinD [Lachnospiraceae bacterium XBB1006]